MFDESRPKSDEEILESDIRDLTDDEIETRRYLEELIQSSFYEPGGPITIVDIIDLMIEKNIIPIDSYDYTKEREATLKRILLDNWDTIEEYEKVIYLCLSGTLPRWGRPYPTTNEFIQERNEFVNRKPKESKSIPVCHTPMSSRKNDCDRRSQNSN